MARKIQVLLVDDLDGTDLGENGTTVSFGFQGTSYEIDLSDKNAKAMQDAFGRYVEHARKAETTSTRRAGGTRRSSPATGHDGDTKAARLWLIQHGFLTSDSRGRISGENWERYNSRNQTKIETPEPKLRDVRGADAGAEAPAVTSEAPKTAKSDPQGNSQKAEKPAPKEKGTAGVAALLP